MIFGGQIGIKADNKDNRDLIIAVSTAKNKWKDWHITHTVKEQFLNDMLGDYYRWKLEGNLSLMVKHNPTEIKQSIKLQVIDLSFQYE